MKAQEFTELLAEQGRELYRDMPWRDDTRPYYVLVSELMLQQTQVVRVIPKFAEFIMQFPDEKSLANATLAEVLKLWQGLGYNRRAKFLHEAAKTVDARGSFPDTYDELIKLPGVGKNTAGAVLAYSYNQPSIFVETNIRAVYIHHFFADNFEVDDKQIITLLEATVDHEHPREFYWALMDYGSWLKSQGVRNNSASKHYRRQSPLKGSVRELRGEIVRQLAAGTTITDDVMHDARYLQAIAGLERDGLIKCDGSIPHLISI